MVHACNTSVSVERNRQGNGSADAMTVAVAGLAAKEKSALAMAMVTVADALSPNFPSLAYEAVREWVPAARVLLLRVQYQSHPMEKPPSSCFHRETRRCPSERLQMSSLMRSA